MLLTRMTTLPFVLLLLSRFVIFNSDYALLLCPLCNSNTLWNILMVLGRSVEQARRHVVYKTDNSAFLTFGIISICYICQ